MTSLAEHQLQMLSLLKGKAPSADENDPYLQRLAGSVELRRLSLVALWWCALTARASCPWTSRLLERLELFELEIDAFYREENISPYAETAARQFLGRQAQSGNSLIAAVAQFELATAELRSGQGGEFVIEWDRDPNQTFQAIRTGAPLPEPEASRWRVKLSTGDQDGVEVEIAVLDFAPAPGDPDPA
jgi:hypothetical protein